MRRACLGIILASGCLLAADRPLGDDGQLGGDGERGGEYPESDWVDVAASSSDICALHEGGALWCGAPDELERVDDSSYVALGGYDYRGACAVRDEGSVVCGLDAPNPYGLGADDGFELAGSFVEVSGTKEAGCALKADGSARCWPDAHAVAGPFSSVGAGDYFACGIGELTGELSCWSIDDLIFEEALDVPGGRYTRVVTADHVACGLSTDGAVRCWGYDFYETVTGPPPGRYADLWLDHDRGCATRMGGAAVCWGEDAGDPNYPELSPPTIALSTIALGNGFGCGITNDEGRLQCWGKN
jgi:hypothetical protein